MKLTELHFAAPCAVDALFEVAPAGDRRSDSLIGGNQNETTSKCRVLNSNLEFCLIF